MSKSGERDLLKLITGMKPMLNEGKYVFITLPQPWKLIKIEETLGTFKEAEGTTVIIRKDKADELNLPYDFIASWITPYNPLLIRCSWIDCCLFS